jgi:hypothetical protein
MRSAEVAAMVEIDWDDPAVQSIIASHDGRQAWDLLQAYIATYQPQRQRIEVRDAIWARRREVMPKRGGKAPPRPGPWRDGPASVGSAR